VGREVTTPAVCSLIAGYAPWENGKIGDITMMHGASS